MRIDHHPAAPVILEKLFKIVLGHREAENLLAFARAAFEGWKKIVTEGNERSGESEVWGAGNHRGES